MKRGRRTLLLTLLVAAASIGVLVAVLAFVALLAPLG